MAPAPAGSPPVPGRCPCEGSRAPGAAPAAGACPRAPRRASPVPRRARPAAPCCSLPGAEGRAARAAAAAGGGHGDTRRWPCRVGALPGSSPPRCRGLERWWRAGGKGGGVGPYLGECVLVVVLGEGRWSCACAQVLRSIWETPARCERGSGTAPTGGRVRKLSNAYFKWFDIAQRCPVLSGRWKDQPLTAGYVSSCGQSHSCTAAR